MIEKVKDAANFLKSTLRLPKSTFPARPHPADVQKYLPRCTDDLYAWQRQHRPAETTFRLHDGPPYANGDLHAGHAINKILKDLICRSKLAEGRRVDYIPGWDCHGLPIELKALEKHGWKIGEDVNPVTIRKAARAFAQKAVNKQMEGFKSWAVMSDWEHHWKTMDKDFEIRQLKVFQGMVKSGLIYRRNKPVFWSPSSGTALAEAELEYKEDHISQAAYVKFPIRGYLHEGVSVSALIWTTTPWTLPANQAIAIDRELQYSLVQSPRHGKFIVATARVEQLKQIFDETLTVLGEDVDNSALLNMTYDGLAQFGHDALDRPIVHADFVSADSGTGLVHCAPGHGMEDYLALQPLLQSGRLVVRAPVDGFGRFGSEATPTESSLLEGKSIFSEGNSAVLAMLGDDSKLVYTHSYRHKYPIDWRTKEPVIIRATAQWFADLSSIRDASLSAIKDVKFLPETGRARLQSFIENRSEWCISRQRAWGVPIPALYHVETGEAVLTEESVNHIINVVDSRGIDAWWSDAPHDPAWILPELDPDKYQRGRDTMDVWFDSGTSWASMVDGDKTIDRPPADIYSEGSDQHRGWFQSSLLTYTARQMSGSKKPCAPFAQLTTHGFTLDEQGKKMSKSLGNVIAPDEIIKGLGSVPGNVQQKKAKSREVQPLGPDVLRLWVASSDWTTDIVISEKVVKTVHTALDKYRVTFKLLLGLLKDFEPAATCSYDDLSQLDKIALFQLSKVTTSVQIAYASFEFHRAVTALNRYVVADLSGFYFEAIKDIMYCESPTSQRRISASTTLYYILSHLQSMLSPITPLLVEESWEHSPESMKTGIEPLRRTFAVPPREWLDSSMEQLINPIMLVNSSVKSAQETARAEKLLGQSLASDVYICPGPSFDISGIDINTWKEILVVSNIAVSKDREVKETIQHLNLQEGQWHRVASISGSPGNEMGTVVVTSPADTKCARCWRYVAKPAEELAICDRCTEAVKEFKD